MNLENAFKMYDFRKLIFLIVSGYIRGCTSYNANKNVFLRYKCLCARAYIPHIALFRGIKAVFIELLKTTFSL